MKEHKSKVDDPLTEHADINEEVLPQTEREITSVEFALVNFSQFLSHFFKCLLI